MQSIQTGATGAPWTHLLGKWTIPGLPFICLLAICRPSVSQQALKGEKLDSQNLAANTRGQLGFPSLRSGAASGRPMASLCLLLGGTWCSRHVSLLVSTTASSKLAALRGSCLASPSFLPLLCTISHTGAESIDQQLG